MKPLDFNAQMLLLRLKSNRNKLTQQQFRTLKGQIYAGDTDGAKRGLENILKRYPKEIGGKNNVKQNTVEENRF